jgi:hypothetical protein
MKKEFIVLRIKACQKTRWWSYRYENDLSTFRMSMKEYEDME